MRDVLFIFINKSARTIFCGLMISAILALSASAQPLSGTKVIGSGGDYATFTAAVNALVTNGVSGPVLFNVVSGSYNEQISIGAVSGTSSTNTVTFRAQSGNAADVTLYFVPTSANNYVVDINEANYITFRNLTITAQTGTSYGSVFRLRGNADNNNIRSCNLQSFSGSYSYIVIANGHSIDNLVIDSNTISSGTYGLYFDGYNNSDHSDGIQFTNNTATNMSVGVFMQYVDSPIITGNNFNNAISTGIQLNYCNGEVRITKNKITGPGNYGIYLYSCIGGTGFPTGAGLVANNFVQCGSAYGIDIYSCSYQNIYYNSVNATSSGGNAYYGYANGTGVTVQNNIFSNTGGGYAVYYGNANGASTMDYNNLYTTGNFIGIISSMSTIDLDAWRTLSGKDANSVSYYPGFTSSTNLKTLSPWLNGEATVIVDVADDIEGEPRDGSTPDIGADEYDPAPSSMTPLSGDYTIGSGGTYATFKLAVADLLLKGVNGPVTFKVLNGNYNEHIVLYNIPGASSTNTITFQANSGNAANATLYFFAAAAESNYVVSMYNADYIRFRKMTLRANNNVGAQYGRVFNMYGSTENFTLDSCIIYGTPDANSSGNYIVLYTANGISRNMTINGNTFNDGGYVLYIDGLNASWPSPNTVVTNNVFNNPDYAGVFLQYHDVPIVNGNTITNPPAFGIEINYGYGNLQVLKNKITGAGNYGIYLYSCIGGTGFPTGPGLVANNFIQCGSAYGIDIYSCSYQNIYYNSVNATSASGYGYYGYANGTDVIVKNNIFANTGGGYAVYYGNANGASTMDYNNLYTSGNFLCLLSSTSTIDLDDWRLTSGKDANSVSYYPWFTSSTNLHTVSPWLNGKGLAFGDVADDIDGNVRDGSTPDIGADEYDPAPSSMTPLSGEYTIGTAPYTTFKLAVADLLLKGVNGPVTFNALSGTYNEHIVLYNIPGASRTNTITFQSESGNPAGTTLYFPAAAAESNYVVQMFQADFFIFKNLTFRANTSISASYGRIFNLYGNVDDLKIEGCVLEGTPNSSSSGNYHIITSNQCILRSLNIIGNTFKDGGYVIVLDGQGNTYKCDSTVISGNTFNNPDYCGIWMQYHDAPVIEGNKIVNPANRGIELNNCSNGLRITKNKIYDCGYLGIYLYACIGGVSGDFIPGLIANNFVHCTASSYGIDINSCANQKIYNNSVNIVGSGSYAFYGYNNTTNVVVQNNIFANTGAGYAVYFANANGATTMDYNDLFTNGSYIGLYGGTNITDLAAWQTASGKDAFSISMNPPFYSPTNLHLTSALLDSTGISVPEVLDDFDGDPRNPVKPDMGADEFSLIVQSVNEMEVGWNMISLPVMVADNRKTTLYPTAGSDAFLYTPSGYAAAESIRIGVGYWMKYPSSQQNTISGYPKLKDTVYVTNGWNMVGAIAHPIPTAAVVPSIAVLSDYFGYNGATGYQSVDTLEPGKGYWVKTGATGTLVLDVNNTMLKNASAVNFKAVLDQLNWLSLGPLRSDANDHLSTKLYFGTSQDKEVDINRFSLPPLPPEGVTDVRFGSGRYVELLDGESTDAIKMPISIQGNNVPLKVSWEIKQQSAVFYLVERNGDKIVTKQLLDQTGTMTIRSNSNHTFAIESEPLPSKITLYQNYPNPFNPSTTISYTLPAASPVTIKVFDLLGQEVATLVNEVSPAGEHTVTFDASALSSGIYFYQLKAGNFVESKKLMLVK